MTKISEMGTKTLVACAIVLGLMAGPSLAEENAHHYQGGPRGTHLTKHPETERTAVQQKKRYNSRYTSPAHRYRGGPTSPTPHSQQ